MRRWSVVALVLLSSGCMAHKLKLLTPEEMDDYTATKVFMSADEQKEFLKLKTQEEHDKWLKGHGHPKSYWDTFYNYDASEREKILGGDVQKGWNQDEVYMAFGQAHVETRLAGRPAERSTLLVYRFEVQPDGSVLVWVPGSKTLHNAVETYQLGLYIDDGVITDIVKKEPWE